MVIKNMEFFGFDIDVVEDYISINIMVNPEGFELNSYRKTPFASLVIKNHMLVDEFTSLKNQGVDFTHHEWVKNKIKLYFSQNTFYCYNMFSDSTQYDKLTDKFKNRLFHTMIYYKDLLSDDIMDEDRHSVVLMAAFPVKGIISPISKSRYYQLYNGCLIHCKPFKYMDDGYTKILYILVNIRTLFSFQEFIPGNTFGKMVNTVYTVDDLTESCTVLSTDRQETSLTMRGHEEFFSKPCKNIFHLSDVPKDILTRSESFSVKM